MIGVPTGPKSGFFAVDPDVPDKPDDANGVAAWRALVEQHGCPDTRTIEPRRRIARPVSMERQPSGAQQSGDLPKGVDVRGDGGYVCVPPSMRHDGRTYEQIGEEIADAPDWLYSLLEAGTKASSKTNGTAPRAWPPKQPLDPALDSEMRPTQAGGTSTDPRDLPTAGHPRRHRARAGRDLERRLHVWWEGRCSTPQRACEPARPVRAPVEEVVQVRPEQVRDKWQEVAAVNNISVGTIFYMADQANPKGGATRNPRPHNRRPVNQQARPGHDNQARVRVGSRRCAKRGRPSAQRFEPLRWGRAGSCPRASRFSPASRSGKVLGWRSNIAVAVATGGACLGQQCDRATCWACSSRTTTGECSGG